MSKRAVWAVEIKEVYTVKWLTVACELYRLDAIKERKIWQQSNKTREFRLTKYVPEVEK